MVSLLSLLSRPPAMSPHLKTSYRASSMKQEFFQFVWNSDVTHQLKRHQIPTSVSVKSTNVQKDISGILAILEPILVASFLYFLNAIRVREFFQASETLFAVFNPSKF